MTYGLGSESDNLPAFVRAARQPEGLPEGGAPTWGSRLPAGRLPGDALPRRSDADPAPGEPPRERRPRAAAAHARLTSARLNERHAPRGRRHRTGGADRLLRAGLPHAAARAGSGGPRAERAAETKALYGLDRPADRGVRHALPARAAAGRARRPLRPALLGGGPAAQWDAHDDLVANHAKLCRWTDRPIAALLKDLKRRGLLDSDAGHLGQRVRPHPRDRERQGPRPQPLRLHHVDGRRRRPGRPGRRAPPTRSASAPSRTLSIHDLHATILHLLGLDHWRLTYLHNGRNERLTDIGGRVIEQVL